MIQCRRELHKDLNTKRQESLEPMLEAGCTSTMIFLPLQMFQGNLVSPWMWFEYSHNVIPWLNDDMLSIYITKLLVALAHVSCWNKNLLEILTGLLKAWKWYMCPIQTGSGELPGPNHRTWAALIFLLLNCAMTSDFPSLKPTNQGRWSTLNLLVPN